MGIVRFETNNEESYSYHIAIEKNGKDFKSIQYSNMNRRGAHDMLNLLKKKYSKEKGYKVKLI
jgi:hypothetical protein